jgi:diadenylate cyclase
MHSIIAVVANLDHYVIRRSTVSLQSHLSERRVTFLESGIDRDSTIRALVALACRANGSMDCDIITTRVFERERALSSCLGAGVAIPHAVLDDTFDSVLAIGVSRDGIEWDSASDGLVHLVILLVSGRMDHLRILSEVAGLLKDPERYRAIVAASTESEVFSLFDDRVPRTSAVKRDGRADISRLTFDKAKSIASEIDRGRLVLHADAIENPHLILELVGTAEAIVVTTSAEKFTSGYHEKLEIITIPFKGIRRSTHVQFALLFLLSQGKIKRDDVIVNVFGVPESGYLDSIRMTHIGQEFDFPMDLQSGRIPSDVTDHVLTRVLQIAGELAAEGREGKPVGTMFVLGDYPNVRDATRQLIMNPFHGYDEIDRNVLDPSLEETVKEYSRIDGAFIIRGDGVIESAGTFLIGQPKAEELQSGLGARHAAALGISNSTDAIAIAISESTRKISIFHAGRRIFFM